MAAKKTAQPRRPARHGVLAKKGHLACIHMHAFGQKAQAGTRKKRLAGTRLAHDAHTCASRHAQVHAIDKHAAVPVEDAHALGPYDVVTHSDPLPSMRSFSASPTRFQPRAAAMSSAPGATASAGCSVT